MTHVAAKPFVALVLLAAYALSFGQEPLPNLQVNLDGKPVTLAPVLLELDTYLVPLRDTVNLLTNGRAELRISPLHTYDILIDGLTRVRIPMDLKAGQNVLVYGLDGPPKALRSLPVEAYPYEITPKGGQPTTFVDVELLCAALGVSVDIQGANMSLLSPSYWASAIGIDSKRIGDRLLGNLQLQPDAGISPPARTILCWVRPSSQGWVQSYRIQDRKVEPLLGQNALGDDVDVMTPEDHPKVRSATPTSPLRFETYNYGDSMGQTLGFVSVVVGKDLGDEDPVKAINSGEIKDSDWAIVGLRQHVTDLPVLFENRPVNAGEDVAAFADRNKNSASIIRALNGLRQGDKPPAGTKLCVIVGLDEDRMKANQKSRYEFKGLYEVQHGDTLKSLASSWGVTTDDILATNPGIPGGGEPMPGDLLNVISSKDGVATQAPSTPQEDTSFGGTAVTLQDAEVHEASNSDSTVVGHIPRSSFVEILGKVDGDIYRVRFKDLMGFVAGSDLRIRESGKQEENADDSIVAREALKFVGTPYLWGGNSLKSGIDCSHFVAQVYDLIGWKEPPPPVTVQETIGDIVHCRPGPARRGGRTIILPDPVHFKDATTNMRALQPGDRIIFQRGQTDASGTRHTGIYIGQVPDSWRQRFGDIPYAFVHASSSRGVTVGSLIARYYWGIYKFSVRSER